MDDHVHKFISGLIKSGTTSPMTKSKIIPRKPFLDLFLKWEEDEKISTWVLCMKTVVLLAFSAMQRPSDVAPRSVVIDEFGPHKMIFDRSKIDCLSDRSLTITFHGIKNDYSRDGFKVHIQRATCHKICPVVTLKNYLDMTSTFVMD